MRSLTAYLLALIITSTLDRVHAKQGPIGPDPKTVSVLYAGKLDSPRMSDAKNFLEKHFAKVGLCDLEGDVRAASSSYDVIVIDWPSIYPRSSDGRIDMSEGNRTLSLPKVNIELTTKPVVMIGSAAAAVALKSYSAIDWECMCLENYAHDFDTAHPIFRGPLPVAIPLESIEKPLNYFLYPGTNKLGEPIQVWRVQDKTYPDVDPGLVSTRSRFTNTPGAEIISGGINASEPKAVAIGRHANLFLWGFSGAVSEMTPSAQSVFVNSICYMTAFKYFTQYEVIDRRSARDDFLISIYYLRESSDAYLEVYSKMMKHEMEMTKLPAELLERLGDNPGESLRATVAPRSAATLEKVPAAIRSATADDTEKLIAYYSDNLEYLQKDSDGKYIADEEVKTLGLSNRSPEFLERCVAMLKNDQNAELARRLLTRYVLRNDAKLDKWQAWYEREGKSFEFDEQQGKFVAPPK